MNCRAPELAVGFRSVAGGFSCRMQHKNALRAWAELNDRPEPLRDLFANEPYLPNRDLAIGIFMRFRYARASVIAIAAFGTLPASAQVYASSYANFAQSEIECAAPRGEVIIIVTGEKFDRTLEETTASVVVLTGEELEGRSIDDLYDAVLRTPNVTQSYGEKGFAIRGIDQRLGAGAGLLVTTVVDGAALPNNRATYFGPYSAWDIEQIEILRGPQGTTQGRNAVGGAIIVNTVDPKLGVFEGKVRSSYSELNTYQLAGALNIPFNESVAARFAIDRRESDGYVYNPVRNENYDQRQSTNVRGKVVFEPNDGLRALYTLNFTRSTGGEDFVEFSLFPERVNMSNDPTQEGSEHWINTFELNLSLNDSLAMTSISSYYTHDYFRQEDLDLSPADLSNLDRVQGDRNFQQELRLNFNAGGEVRGLFGLFLGRYERDLVDTTQVPTTVINPSLPGGLVFRDRTIASKEENFAVFGEVELDVTNKLTLIVGARFDTESSKSDALSHTLAVADNGAFQPFLDQVVAQLAPDELIQVDARYDAFLPKLGLRYALSQEVTLGFTTQRAYRAGGSGISTISQTVYNYDPEYTWTYEGSLRANMLGGKLNFAAHLFYTDWTNQIVNQLLDPNIPQDFIAVNAGHSRLYGAELQVEVRATPTFAIYGSLGLLNTRFEDYVTDNAEYNGNVFPYAPPISFSAGFDWRHPNGFRVLGDVSAKGAHFSDTINDATRTTLQDGLESCIAKPCNSPLTGVPSYAVVNLKAGFEAEAFSIYAFARNLLDKNYITQLQVQGNARSGRPRTAGVEANFRF